MDTVLYYLFKVNYSIVQMTFGMCATLSSAQRKRFGYGLWRKFWPLQNTNKLHVTH